jgi:hypothetical protein
VPTPGSETTVASAGASLLVQSQQHAQNVVIRNAGATNSAYIGDANVTGPAGAMPGYELPPGVATPTIQMAPEEAIYAICASGLTTRVDVFQSFSA